MRVSRFWVLSLPALPALSAYLFLHFIWWCKNPLHLTAHTRDWATNSTGGDCVAAAQCAIGYNIKGYHTHGMKITEWRALFHVVHIIVMVNGTTISNFRCQWKDYDYKAPSASEIIVRCVTSHKLYELDPNMIWHPVRLVGLVRV